MTAPAPAPAPTTMLTVQQQGYGDADRLHVERRAVPTPAPNQVLVRVEAMSPDSGTLHFLRGHPRLLRLFMGLRTPRQPAIGLVFSGTVAAIGSEVAEAGAFAVGDRVAGSAPGALAQYVLARPGRLAIVPEGVAMTDAATVPVSGVTALQAIRDAARVTAGQRVLVIGAGGGVGSFLTQLAVLQGAHVTGVASAAKAPFVRSLGAENVIDYRATPEPADWGRFDVIIDTADGRALHVLRRALAPAGTLVIVGADGAGGPLLDGVDRQLRAALLNPWVRHRLVPLAQRETGFDVAVMLEHLAAGRVRASVDAVVPFAQAAEAMVRMARQDVRGKIVVDVTTAAEA